MVQKGEDVSEIQALMSQLPALIQQGRLADAKARIDRALELTGSSAHERSDKETEPSADQSRNAPTFRLPKHFSPKGVRDEFEADVLMVPVAR